MRPWRTTTTRSTTRWRRRRRWRGRGSRTARSWASWAAAAPSSPSPPWGTTTAAASTRRRRAARHAGVARRIAGGASTPAATRWTWRCGSRAAAAATTGGPSGWWGTGVRASLQGAQEGTYVYTIPNTYNYTYHTTVFMYVCVYNVRYELLLIINKCSHMYSLRSILLVLSDKAIPFY